MAKDLTYFKFVVSEWNDGDITTCSFAAQGLFANLCSLYWSREGNLSIKFAQKKFAKATKKIWNELESEGLFKVNEGKIIINFLDEQLNNLENVSKLNSDNAKSGWKRRKPHATASVSHCDNLEVAMPIDKIREEEDKNKIKPFSSDDYFQSGEQAFEEIKADELFVERLLRIVHGNGFRACDQMGIIMAVRKFLVVEQAKDDFCNRLKSEVKQHLVNWINKNANAAA